MDILIKVLQIVAPVFTLAAIGFVWVRLKLGYDLALVTRLAMQLGLPCLMFTALARADLDLHLLSDLALATGAGYLAVTVLSLSLCMALGLDLRAFLSPIIFGNTGNLGLPVAYYAFGETGLAYAMVVFALMAIMNFTFGVWLVSGRGSREMLRQPITYAVILGGAAMLTRWQPPGWVMNTLDLAGQIAIPLMLLTLGVAMASLGTGAIGRALMLALAKLGIGLAAGVAVVTATGLGFGTAGGAVILQLSMPVAVTSYLLAARYDTRPGEVAGLVVVSTLLAVPAIPLLLAFLLSR
ncbi:MAG: AEC family transporter [Alphaproteobacteria bacterium]|nr:MAG: AEC family transporter [Alphaproteobacteria bacterium]